MELVIVERSGAVATLTLNRPEAKNALSHPLMKRLHEALWDLEKDGAVRAVILSGGPGGFSAGADIKEMDGASAQALARDPHLSHWDYVGQYPKPLVAAVSGFAFGGGLELALACDMIVCGETARLGQPEINIGVIPGAGGTQRLARALGKALASELVMTGRPLSARRAYDLGLVNRVVSDETVLAEARRLADEIAARPPLAVQAAKRAILAAAEKPLSESLQIERRLFYSLFETQDQKEGMRAFIEKRQPVFSGR